MNARQFSEILQDQTDRVDRVLGDKAAEYATDDDRLANFKVAAELQGLTPIQALGGMMAKHTVSIYDMIANHDIGVHVNGYPVSQWDEKITDHINYLILLKALVAESHPENQ